MRSARFIASSETTKHPAALSSVVTNSAANISSSDSVHENKEDEDSSLESSATEAVPDIQPFLLKSGNMSKTRKEERVEMFGVFWAGDYAANKIIPDFVALVRSEVENNPYIDPAIGFFVLE